MYLHICVQGLYILGIYRPCTHICKYIYSCTYVYIPSTGSYVSCARNVFTYNTLRAYSHTSAHVTAHAHQRCTLARNLYTYICTEVCVVHRHVTYTHTSAHAHQRSRKTAKDTNLQKKIQSTTSKYKRERGK